MELLRMPVQLRWADFDANFHLRHSAYYDFGAMARIKMFSEVGLTEETFITHAFGPILLKEECVFRKEIKMNDQLEITAALTHCRPDGARFRIRHQLFKDGHILAAEINILGDWLNMTTRKLLLPPALLTDMVMRMPRAEDFQFS
jgi:acyl-CoA thioester hydrolase